MSATVSVVAIAAIAAAVLLTQPRDTATNAEAKRYNVAGAPEQAAACIARNGEGETPALMSFVQPLYGAERVALVMRETATGDTLRVVYLEPARQGSYATITSPQAADNDALIKRLLAKC